MTATVEGRLQQPARARRQGPAVRRGLLSHAPALDGLRGFALVAIVVYHFTRGDTRTLPGGSAAVDVFFALSGFLITALLLDELRVHGRLQLGRFWARRGLRLLPALLLMLAVWTAMLLAFSETTWFSLKPSKGVWRASKCSKVGLASSPRFCAPHTVSSWRRPGTPVTPSRRTWVGSRESTTISRSFASSTDICCTTRQTT